MHFRTWLGHLTTDKTNRWQDVWADKQANRAKLVSTRVRWTAKIFEKIANVALSGPYRSLNMKTKGVNFCWEHLQYSMQFFGWNLFSEIFVQHLIVDVLKYLHPQISTYTRKFGHMIHMYTMCHHACRIDLCPCLVTDIPRAVVVWVFVARKNEEDILIIACNHSFRLMCHMSRKTDGQGVSPRRTTFVWNFWRWRDRFSIV